MIKFHTISLFLLVPQKELEIKMLNIALKTRSSYAGKQTKKKFGEVFEDRMLLSERYPAENAQYSQTRFHTTLCNRSYNAAENEYKRKEKKFKLPQDGDLNKKFSEQVTVEEQETQMHKKSEIHSTHRMTGDFGSDEFDHRSTETGVFPFEHKDLYDSEDISSADVTLQSERIQIIKPDPFEKSTTKNDLLKSTDKDKIISKQKKQLDILAKEKVTCVADKQDDLVNCKTEKSIKESHENETSSKFTSKWIFRKFVNMAFDEIFYTGVMQSGSFISQLSKDLTA